MATINIILHTSERGGLVYKTIIYRKGTLKYPLVMMSKEFWDEVKTDKLTYYELVELVRDKAKRLKLIP